jgi:hypothetical protein
MEITKMTTKQLFKLAYTNARAAANDRFIVYQSPLGAALNATFDENDNPVRWKLCQIAEDISALSQGYRLRRSIALRLKTPFLTTRLMRMRQRYEARNFLQVNSMK